jgi:hypothetical protein
MGSRLKKFLVAVLALSFMNGSAYAATKSPSATPTIKATIKATASPTSKVSSMPSAKTSAKTSASASARVSASAKNSAISSAKPTATSSASASASASKKVIYEPRPRKSVKITPSPKPVWPPKGYAKNDDIYAKVPTSKELIGLSSANKKVANDLKACENLTCGAIFATSSAGCNWWEFIGDVTGPTSETDQTIIKYGVVKSLFGASKAKEIQTYIMVSQEPINTGFTISNIQMLCHRDAAPPDLKIPSHSYVKSN